MCLYVNVNQCIAYAIMQTGIILFATAKIQKKSDICKNFTKNIGFIFYSCQLMKN